MKVTKVEQAEIVYFDSSSPTPYRMVRSCNGDWDRGDCEKLEAAYQRYKARDKKIALLKSWLGWTTAEEILDKLEAIDRGEG